MKKGFILGVFLTLFVLLIFGGAYYLGTQSKSTQKSATTQITETIITPTP